jgi:hypothetical protein
VVAERSGYGDWSVLARQSDRAWRLADAAPTGKSGLRPVSALQQLPAARHPGAVIKERTQRATGRRGRRRVGRW